MTPTLASSPRGNILIIDHKPDHLSIIKSLLLEANNEIRQATNKQMAFTAIHSNAPDLILLNIDLPDLNAEELFEFLQASPLTKSIPVILIGTLERITELEPIFSDYITKPFQQQDILTRVKNQLIIYHQRKQLEQQKILLQQEINKRQELERELETLNQQLDRLVTLDPLTQIGNRRLFDEYLLREWRRGIRDKLPLTLILCDLDYFKLYNDCYGHQAGDQCLLRIAQALVRSVSRPADLIARYGGEEFALILPNTNHEGGITIAQKIQNSIAALKIPHAQSPMSEYVTISLGIACLIPNQETSQKLLLQYADKAISTAKDKGKNCIILTDLSGTQIAI